MSWPWIAAFVALSVAAALALFLGVMYVIGRGLSEDHRHTCTLTLRQPPAVVCDTIGDIAAWPQWDPGVQRVEQDSATPAEFRGRIYLGRNAMSVVSRRVDPPRVHEIHVEDLRAKIFSGLWRYEIVPTADGCSVTLTEEGKIRPAIPRAMARKLADPKMYLKRHLKLLAKKFGEEPRLT